MMFRTTTITLFLASASVVNGRDLCFPGGYEDTINLALEAEECHWKNIFKPVQSQFKANKAAAKAAGEKANCPGGASNEIMALTGTESIPDAKGKVRFLCAKALYDAADEALEEDGSWGDIEGTGVDLEEFFDGDGFLNKETGNFQQNEDDFANTNKYIYTGDDPRNNDHYPTTEESYIAGEAINEVFNGIAKTTKMLAPTGNFECASNTAMCCWHRDRQYEDNNGGCDAKDCANEDPGDNTDLCWTKSGADIFPYPKHGTEGDLHCHGLGWANVPDKPDDKTDVNTETRFNTLFFVSLYDHLYQRGYAEAITNDPNIEGDVPMCGCVEDMPAVARADCSEIDATTEYTVTVAGGQLVVEPVEGTFAMDFQACEGHKYVEGYTPDDYLEDINEGDMDLIKNTNNDLAGFTFKQYLKGKITSEQYDTFKETVVGYYRNDIQNKGGRDARREETCEDAYLAKFGGTYEEQA